MGFVIWLGKLFLLFVGACLILVGAITAELVMFLVGGVIFLLGIYLLWWIR